MGSLRLFVIAAVCLLLPATANATSYGDFIGADVDFLDVQDTYGLYEAPSVFDNQLFFFPSNFKAEASGGASQTTEDLLNATIMATTLGHTIDELMITEYGDTTLTGVGTAATNSNINLGGVVVVLEQNGVAIAPVVIPFSGSYSPSNVFSLPGDSGLTNWQAGVTIDVASVVPGATKVELQFDNNLSVNTEVGTTASIQKKFVDGPLISVEVVPEPTTAVLLASAMLGFALRRRASI
jgi:hypothetical protein